MVFGLFKKSGNVVSDPKVLIASVGLETDSYVLEDRRIYQDYFGDIEIFEAKDIQDFYKYINGNMFDILHLFAAFDDDGSIEGESGPDFFRHVVETQIKIFILANDNRGERLVPFCSEAVNAGFGSMNLVMTLERKGDSFVQFFKNLFAKMIKGLTMPQAWVELAPQNVKLDREIPETVFSAGYGSLKITAQEL